MSDLIFPLELSKLSSNHTFATTVTTLGFSGKEQRISHRDTSLESFNASFAVKDLEDAQTLYSFFLLCNGRFKTFLLKDPTDYQTSFMGFAVNGQSIIQIERIYKDYLGNEYRKAVRKPNLETLRVFVDTAELEIGIDYFVNSLGQIELTEPMVEDTEFSYTCEFHKQVRFNSDEQKFEMLAYWVSEVGAEQALNQIPDIEMVEVY